MVIEVNLRLDCRLFHLSVGHLDFFMDGHPQATVVLFPCSLLHGFKEAAMAISLFHHFICFLLYGVEQEGEYSIHRSPPEMSHMAGDRDVSYGWRPRCLVWLETGMFRMAGDRDVLFGWGWWCLIWTEMTVDCCTSWWYSVILVLSYIYWPCGPLR